ncbi:MAG: hypothetical protein AAGF31_00475 [Planctomycetota bacterium]
MAIGELAVNVTARTAKANKNVTGFRKNVRTLGPVVDMVGGKMRTLAAGLAGFVAFRKLQSGVQGSLKSIDKLAKTSRKLGIATDQLAGLRLAAEESGVASNTLDMALQRMVRRVGEAANGTGEARGALKELGIDAQSLAAMSPDEQFRVIADAMSRVSTQGDRVRLAFKLFDSEGVALVNTLAGGRKAMDEATDSARKLGIAVNETDAAKVEAANDAYGRLGKSVEGLFNKVAIGLAPAVERVSEGLTAWITTGDQATDSLTGGSRLIARGMGIAADVVHTLRMGFKGLQVVVTGVIAKIVTDFDVLQKTIVAVLNKIPGVDVKASTFVTSLAEGLRASTAKGAEELKQMFLADPPSVAIDKWFDDVESKAEDTGKKVAEKLAPDPKQLAAITNAGQRIGGFLAQGLNGLRGLGQQAIGAVASTFAGSGAPTVSGQASINRAIDARSSEGMAALRANQRNRPAEKAAVKTEQNTKKTNDLLGKMLTVFQNLPTISIPSA